MAETPYTQGFKAGIESERNRIILLLNMNDIYNLTFVTDDLIELIKGKEDG